VVLMPLMLAAVYFSYTRSVWMGAGLGLMVVLGLSLRGAWRPLVLGGMVTAALLLAVSRMDQLVSFQREQSAADTGKSVDMRGSFAYVSWKMFLDRPLLGFGFGRFPEAKLAYLSDRSTGLDLESIRPFVHHNTFLSVLTEAGLVGMVLYVAVLIGWGHAAWALCRNPKVPGWVRSQGVLLLGVLAVYVCQAAFHELTYSPIENTLLFLMAGITVGLRPLPGPQAAPAPARLGSRLLRPAAVS
jgi:O-antigen ligase